MKIKEKDLDKIDPIQKEKIKRQSNKTGKSKRDDKRNKPQRGKRDKLMYYSI